MLRLLRLMIQNNKGCDVVEQGVDVSDVRKG